MKRLLTILILIIFPTVSALAVKVSSLYQIDMPVDTQMEEERGHAVKQAFIQILMKLTGDPDIAKNPDIKANLQKAGYFVQEYSYATPPASVSQYQLHLRFNANDVNRLLRTAGVAYWGDERPLILVWLTITKDMDAPEIIGNENPGELLTFMKDQGKKYGLPIIFPMMDVTDLSQISADDVDAMTMKTIKYASKRYNPDVLLIGNIKQSSQDVESQWQLVLGNHYWDFSQEGTTPDAVITGILNQVNQTLAKQYVVKQVEPIKSWINLQVMHIAQRSDLAQLLQYLKQLGSVQEIKLSQITGDVVELSILIRGPLMAFQKNIAVGQRLIFRSQDQTNNKLIYDWVH